jgi:hypothetical protein
MIEKGTHTVLNKMKAEPKNTSLRLMKLTVSIGPTNEKISSRKSTINKQGNKQTHEQKNNNKQTNKQTEQNTTQTGVKSTKQKFNISQKKKKDHTTLSEEVVYELQ